MNAIQTIAPQVGTAAACSGFTSFDRLPKILVIDNLRAAVKHPDWFDPELVPEGTNAM